MILIAITALLLITGAALQRYERSGIFLAVFGIAVFAVIGVGSLGGLISRDAQIYTFLGSVAGSLTYDAIFAMNAPPAYVLILKMCVDITGDAAAFPIVIACIQTVLAVYAVYEVCRTPYEGAAVFMCFIPAYFAGSAVFTASLVCLLASGYVKERRFFRFAAVAAAAACFDTSALLLLPLYFILIIPNPYLSAVLSTAAAALMAMLPGVKSAVFGVLDKSPHYSAEMPVVCAVVTVAAAIVGLLIYKMFRNRGGKYERLVPVLVCGAAFTAASVIDPDLFPAAMMLTMMSAVALAPEAYAIGDKFVGILFRESKETAQRIFLAVCVVLTAGVTAFLVLSDSFGCSVFQTAVETAVML